MKPACQSFRLNSIRWCNSILTNDEKTKLSNSQFSPIRWNPERCVHELKKDERLLLRQIIHSIQIKTNHTLFWCSASIAKSKIINKFDTFRQLNSIIWRCIDGYGNCFMLLISDSRKIAPDLKTAENWSQNAQTMKRMHLFFESILTLHLIPC